jgi:hypothetical protein
MFEIAKEMQPFIQLPSTVLLSLNLSTPWTLEPSGFKMFNDY